MDTMDATRCLDDYDRDFKYKHANDSHSWLTNYPGSLKPDPNELKISYKNETFTEHEIRKGTTKGKRKMLLEAFYRKILTDEIIKKFEEDEIVVEDYKTDYMERFKHPDDMPLPGEVCSKNEKLKNAPDSQLKETSKDSKLEEVSMGEGCKRETEKNYNSTNEGLDKVKAGAEVGGVGGVFQFAHVCQHSRDKKFVSGA